MRKLFISLIMMVIFLAVNAYVSFAYENEIKEIAASISQSIAKSNKKTIAVVDFVDLQGNVTELGRFIAEELSGDLTISATGFEVIERNHLKSILAEHKLSLSGLVNPNTIKKLGQIAGVDAIVTGSVTPFGDSVRVSAKVIATDTARVIGAAKGDIAKTKAIEELLARGIETGTTSASNVESTSSRPKPHLKAQQIVEAKGFNFELNTCKLSGQSVTCSLMITSKDNDKRLSVRGGQATRIVDDSGNEYKSQEVTVGNESRSGQVDKLMVAGVPTKALVKFEGISSQPNSIALLELYCWSGDDFRTQFRNIPLSR